MIGIVQPLLYLFLFGPRFAKVAASTPGFPPGNGWMVLTPALIVQLVRACLDDQERSGIPAIVNSVLMPLLLLSGILLPITTGLAPQWLYNVARFNPFRYVVAASRASFRSDFTMDALFTGCVVLAVMTLLAVWSGARTFQRENA
jgi:ABC-type multidrug transport system permease subunit